MSAHKETFWPARNRIFPLLLLLIAVADCAWILSLPVFPTQDGPMHLYVARIMQALLLHQEPGIFVGHYFIKYLLPPYSLYYYLLLALGHGISLVTADQVVICGYVVLFLFGFRYLARSIGPSGDVTSLLAAPLVLNWPLAMGFVNFGLSTALSFWALGLWCRQAKAPAAGARNLWRRIGFVLLCVLMMLTHPVPLGLVLGYCLLDLILRSAGRRTFAVGRSVTPAEVIALLAASSTVLYIKAFTISQVFVSHGRRPFLFGGEPLVWVLSLHSLMMFGSDRFTDVLYEALLYLLLALSLALGGLELLRSRRRGYRWTSANTWFVLALAMGPLVLILPPDLNGSAAFAARLVLFIWMTGLAAASALDLSDKPGLRLGPLTLARPVVEGFLALFGVSVTAFGLLLAIHHIAPVARQLGEIESVSLPERHRVLLALDAPDYETPRDLYFDPYMWSVGRIVRRTDSVLYNTPWLTLSIIPVGTGPHMATTLFNPDFLENPEAMRTLMRSSAEAASTTFADIDAVSVNHGTRPGLTAQDPIFGLDPQKRRWSCVERAVFTLCTPVPTSGTATSSGSEKE